MSVENQDHLEPIRQAVLQAALPHVPFDGWTDGLFVLAAEELNEDAAMLRLAFPSGAMDLIEYHSRDADRRMIEALARVDPVDMSIRARIASAIRTRLELLEKEKEAVRRAVAYEAIPVHSPSGVKLAAETCDLIWRWAGDRSNDYNFYTKRLMLGGVYGSVLLFWLGDASEGHSETWGFLDRRIENVMQVEKAKAQIISVAENLPSPAKLLGRLRYGALPKGRKPF
ncbi:MAG: COQ9 family protein [Alphaproteobacteria bacterium]